jgi:MFS family permease
MNLNTTVMDENLKNFRHNYLVNVLDGSFFWLGYSFIAPSVILPLYVSHFTSNKLIIGFVAVLSSMGYFFPQLFTSNWVENIPVKKVLPVNVGFFTERLPILLLPFSALFALSNPGLALSLMLFVFAWHSFGAGVVAVAWNSMIAKVIPVDKRGVFMGITTFGGNATGIIGASFAAIMLDRLLFPYGFMVCFALAAVAIFISWFFLAQTREEPDIITKLPVSHKAYWKDLPLVFFGDRNLQRYLFAQLFIGLGGMAWGFMAVYAVDTWSLSDGKVGTFTTALLIGQTIANVLFGLLGDRKGYKLVLILSLLFAIAGLSISLMAIHPDWMYLVFGLRGASLSGLFMAGMIVYEFSAADKRPTYIGLNNTWLGIQQLIAPLIGGFLAQSFGYPVLFLTAVIFSSTGLLVLFTRFKEPRTLQQKSIPSN